GQQPGQQAGSKQDRFVKLSPQARIYPREQSIPAIPLYEIQHYLADVRVVPGRQSDEWPYVLSTVIDSTAHRVYAAVGKVYVRGKLDPAQVTYSVYRERRLYRDPALPDRILGQELVYVGDVEIIRFGDPSIGFIKSFKRPLRQGDRLYVQQEGEDESLVSFFPRPPSREVSGQIIDVFGGLVVAAERQVVVLDVGENAGVEVGHVLAIQQQQIRFEDPLSAELMARQDQAERIRFRYEDVSATDNLLSSIFNDVRGLANTFNRSGLVRYIGGPTQHPEQVELEGQRNGHLLVFRTFPEVSYGLIMDIDFPVYLHDLVKNP
ncbi:MAG: hypothetical protein OXU61_06140, partial [Gammaproteobacteria bacterium]|nr:hypothetical protein [Gammaproteobacteria bacterium]